MNQSHFKSMRISASAGSGKTYRLALRYIALLVLGANPEHMIALTFTRKAAGEFTDRIITRLAEAARNEVKASKLAEEVIQTINGEGCPPLLSETPWKGNIPNKNDFQVLLAKLIHALGRLNMSTLDSFFSRMTQALALDLGVASIRLYEDNKLLKDERQKALEVIYEKIPADKELRDDFAEIFKLATLGNQEARVDRTINELLDQYHNDYLDAPDFGLWGNIDQIWGRERPWWLEGNVPLDKAIQNLKKLFDDEIATADGFSEKVVKALHSLIDVAEKSDPDKKLSAPIYSTDNISSWLSGAYSFTFNRKTYTLEEHWCEAFLDVLGGYVREGLLNVASKARGIYKMMKAADSQYDKKVRSQGKLLFADVTRLLLADHGDSLTSQSLDDLRYRMDGWFEHWLLDEFQDTSHEQWRVIEPFLDEVAQDPEHTRSIFVVGDTKQSIYQWRGGDPVIFDNLVTHSPWKQTFVDCPMDVSYRSSPAIMDFVNKVCDFRKTASDASQEAKDRWQFRQHTSAPHLRDMTGCAQLWFQKKKEADDVESSFKGMTELLKKVNPLGRADALTKKKLSCAILVESNKRADEIRDWLVSEAGGAFPVVVESDLQVGTDSTIGITLEQFFKWLYRPSDLVAFQYLKMSPYNVLGDDNGEEWKRWQRIYELGGISEVLRIWEQLQNQLDPSRLSSFDLQRLKIWQQLAEDFDAQGNSLSAWFPVIETMKRREHASEGAVQIMTWHKAKGLEFDVVIIPFPPKKQGYSRYDSTRLLKNLDDYGNTRGIILSPKQELLKFDRELTGWKDKWKSNCEFEGFCKLYVALTRAKRACYLFLPPKTKSSGKDKGTDNIGHADILNGVLSDLTQIPSVLGEAVDEMSYYEGDPEWYFSCPECSSEEETVEEEKLRLPRPQSVAKMVSPSSLGHDDQMEALAYSPEALQLGTDVHRCLAEIEWLDDEAQRLMKTWPDSVKDLLCQSFLSHDFARYFKRPQGASQVHVWRELPVAGELDGKIISGIADRVTLVDGFLTVIDFKTDKGCTPDTLKERYQAQLQCYRRLLCTALNIPDEKSSCVILAVRQGSAIEFGADLSYQTTK